MLTCSVPFIKNKELTNYIKRIDLYLYKHIKIITHVKWNYMCPNKYKS